MTSVRLQGKSGHHPASQEGEAEFLKALNVAALQYYMDFGGSFLNWQTGEVVLLIKKE